MKRYLEKLFYRTTLQKKARYFVILGALVFMLALMTGCGGNIHIGEINVPQDSVQLDLKDAGLTDISKLSRCKDLRFADLRGNDLSAKQIDQLHQALPNCEVLWSVPLDGRRFDSDSEAIADPAFSDESANMLQWFPALQAVDASGSTDYAALTSAARQYPAIAFYWTVSLGNQVWPFDAEQIVVASRTASAEDIEAALSGLPQLKSVDLAGTGITPETAAQWQARYPDVTFTTTVDLNGQAVRSDAISIDLSGQTDVSLSALEEALPTFYQLKTVNLRGCDLTIDEQRALQDAFPDILFLWRVDFIDGIVADSADSELILSEHIIPDVDALAAKLALLPELKTVEMCNCGLTDDQMQGLRDQFPNIKFVWMIHVGYWEIRTDIRAFSMAQAGEHEGVRFTKTGEESRRYRWVDDEEIAKLRYCTDIEALDIGHGYLISNISFLRELPKLRFLVISMTKVLDLSPIGSLKNLIFLEMFEMNLTDVSVLYDLPQLEYLNCSSTMIADIDPLLSLTNLKRLWIIHCGFSDETLHTLKVGLPNAIVIAQGKHSTATGWRFDNPSYLEMQALFGLPPQLDWQTAEYLLPINQIP